MPFTIRQFSGIIYTTNFIEVKLAFWINISSAFGIIPNANR